MKKHLLLRFTSLIILISLVASCSKENDPGLEDNGTGSFNLTISGDEEYTFIGEAFFEQLILDGGSPDDRGTTLSLIGTNNSENSFAISMMQAGIRGFGEGTYTYIEEPENNQVFLGVSIYSANSGTTYFITSGSVKFDRVTDKIIEGSLEIEMQNFNEGKISVSGSFKARDLLFF
jgi:hypothetical protein